MFEGVLHKESHAQEEGEAADPGEKLGPINCSQLIGGLGGGEGILGGEGLDGWGATGLEL